MSGFNTGNTGSAFSSAKQLGAILRGFGPPVPALGVIGDLYIDTLTFQLYECRAGNTLDPWGHYLFVVPTIYQSALKFFGTTSPPDALGEPGDYYLQWAGYSNYGMQPAIFGPKMSTGWGENGDGPGTVIAPGTGSNVIPTGLLAEGANLTDKQLSQLLAVGLAAEYAIPVPVTANDGDPVDQTGLQSGGAQLNVTINPRYTAIDNYTVS
jgi:hypothetical protein